MRFIHPSAIVAPECELGEAVHIGPGCVLTGRVVLGDNVRLLANVHLHGPVEIGADVEMYPNVCVGFPGQDFKFKPGMVTAGVKIGAGSILREGVTVHAATSQDNPTTLGERVFMMVNSHIGHDSIIGNDVILVNGALLAGFTVISDKVILGGNAAVHQFCRVGRMTMIGGLAAVSVDVPPFCICPVRNTITGLNMVGMRRGGIPREQITRTREAFRKALVPNLLRQERIDLLTKMGEDCPPIMEIAEFIKAGKRPIATPPRERGRGKNTQSETLIAEMA